MKRALIIDPDVSTQHRFAHMLSRLWPQVVVDAAHSLTEAYSKLSRAMPGLLIADFYLPDGSGLEFIDQARHQHPNSPRVIVTRHADSAHIMAGITHGVDGYILKDQPDIGIERLLTCIAKGEPGLSPEIVRLLLQCCQRSYYQHHDADGRRARSLEQIGLTERETQVLALLSRGYDRHQVGESLMIRPSTVAGHIKAIYLKLNVSTRAEATLAAVKLGLVDLDGAL